MKIKYLTWLYERTGKHEEIIQLPESIQTISDVLDYLESSRPEYNNVFKHRHVIYSAVNDEMRPHDFPISNTDEISLFSAMVGG